MLERDFQSRLVKEIKSLFPRCIVIKSDPGYIQGLPDLFIFYRDRWAALECKRSENARRQANQRYYVERMNNMSFARFVCPENKRQVLYELEQAFGP